MNVIEKWAETGIAREKIVGVKLNANGTVVPESGVPMGLLCVV